MFCTCQIEIQTNPNNKSDYETSRLVFPLAQYIIIWLILLKFEGMLFAQLFTNWEHN